MKTLFLLGEEVGMCWLQGPPGAAGEEARAGAQASGAAEGAAGAAGAEGAGAARRGAAEGAGSSEGRWVQGERWGASPELPPVWGCSRSLRGGGACQQQQVSACGGAAPDGLCQRAVHLLPRGGWA